MPDQFPHFESDNGDWLADANLPLLQVVHYNGALVKSPLPQGPPAIVLRLIGLDNEGDPCEAFVQLPQEVALHLGLTLGRWVASMEAAGFQVADDQQPPPSCVAHIVGCVKDGTNVTKATLADLERPLTLPACEDHITFAGEVAEMCGALDWTVEQ